MEQIRQISHGSQGQLISTLQDLRHGRETEMQHLNLAVTRLAESMHPALTLPRTHLLGQMILAKSRGQRTR